MNELHPDWITHRLPTAADAGDDGDVQIPETPNEPPSEDLTCNWQHWSLVVPGQPWWSVKAAANASPAPAPFHPEPFDVRRFSTDARPFIRGNGFDGLELGENLEEANKFISWINARLSLLAPASAPTRKVVQIAVTPNTPEKKTTLYALCSDSTIWWISDCSAFWTQIPPIPQPEAAQ